MAQLKVNTTIDGNTAWHAGNDGTLAKQVSVARTVPTTVGDYVEVAQFSGTNRAHSGIILLKIDSASFSLAKTYTYAANWDETDINWVKVAPLNEPGAYSGNDVHLEMNMDSDVLKFRLVRDLGATAGTANITIIYNEDSTHTDISATGTGSSSTWYDHAKLYQSTDLYFGDNRVLTDADGAFGDHVAVSGDTMIGNLFVSGAQLGVGITPAQRVHVGLASVNDGIRLERTDTALGIVDMGVREGISGLSVEVGGTVGLEVNASTVVFGQHQSIGEAQFDVMMQNNDTFGAYNNALNGKVAIAKVNVSDEVELAGGEITVTTGGDVLFNNFVGINTNTPDYALTIDGIVDGGGVRLDQGGNNVKLAFTDQTNSRGFSITNNRPSNILVIQSVNGTGGFVENLVSFSSSGDLTIEQDDGYLYFGSAEDTNLFRAAANSLKTDDSFTVGSNLTVSGTGLFSSTVQVAAPTASNHAVTKDYVDSKRYSTTVGNGTDTAITVTHNLGSRDVHVTIYETASPYAEFQPSAIEHATTNAVDLTFASAPSSGQYTVFVTA